MSRDIVQVVVAPWIDLIGGSLDCGTKCNSFIMALKSVQLGGVLVGIDLTSPLFQLLLLEAEFGQKRLGGVLIWTVTFIHIHESVVKDLTVVKVLGKEWVSEFGVDLRNSSIVDGDKGTLASENHGD